MTRQRICPQCIAAGSVGLRGDTRPCPNCDAIRAAIAEELENAARRFDDVGNEADCRIEHGVDGVAGQHVAYFRDRCRKEAAAIRARSGTDPASRPDLDKARERKAT
ncbi:MAG TPA: hypothetical protein VJB38_12355 [Bacteroidota bacterium]|nr:hypothetical protein [Bacteroidota bacterium]